MHTYTTVLLSLYSKQWANPVCLLKISAILKRLMTRIIQMWDTKRFTENGQSKSIMGPLWEGKVMTDIFGIQNIVLNWTFSLVSELLYTGMFLSSQNQHSFLYPFIMLELQNFFPRCLDLIKLEHLMTTRYTYKCNNCALYLYLYYQALCLLLEWEI